MSPFHALMAEGYGSVLLLLQAGFTIWMLVDCRQRGQDQTWFWVILWFQPLGAWAYFFAVKLNTMRRFHTFHASGTNSWLSTLFQRRASLEELRYQAERAPTLASRLALAERLIEKKEYSEAIPLLEAALKSEPGYSQLGYSLALCHLRLGKPEQAIPFLQDVIRRDPRWHDYEALRLLIEAQTAQGETIGALESCRELARYVPTLENHCLLAEHLIGAGQAKEARLLLDNSLRDNDFAPSSVRWRNRRWANEARRLLKDTEGKG
jgi:hypothetical protein